MKNFFRVTVFTKNESFTYGLDAEDKNDAKRICKEITATRVKDMTGAKYQIEVSPSCVYIER